MGIRQQAPGSPFPGADAVPDDDDDLPEILARRKIRHRKAQARSAAKRKARNAPRRDDVARIGLFITLMQYRGSKHDGAREVVRTALVDLLVDAGFDRDEAGRTFDGMVPRVGSDLDGYLLRHGTDLKVRNVWRGRNGLAPVPDRSATDTE